MLVPFSIVGSVYLCSPPECPAEVTAGTRVESPDREFVVECKVGEQLAPAVGLIEILDKRTGSTARSFEINPPLYALKWTADSKTIVAVQHVAGGSVAQIIHLSSGKWTTFEASPPVGDEATVVKVVPQSHVVELTYKVNQKPASSHPGRSYLCTFVVDPETSARHFNEACHEIDLDTYSRLRLQN